MSRKRDAKSPGAEAVGENVQVAGQSILDLLAIAQGWHERAVMLRFLGFEVSSLFCGEKAKCMIKSLGGGSVPVSESQVASLSAELLDAAELARQQVETLLGIMMETTQSGAVPSLGGRGVVVATATPIAIPDLDEAVVVRTEPEPIAGSQSLFLRGPSSTRNESCACLGAAPRLNRGSSRRATLNPAPVRDEAPRAGASLRVHQVVKDAFPERCGFHLAARCVGNPLLHLAVQLGDPVVMGSAS